jgi:hypothetical protein
MKKNIRMLIHVHKRTSRYLEKREGEKKRRGRYNLVYDIPQVFPVSIRQKKSVATHPSARLAASGRLKSARPRGRVGKPVLQIRSPIPSLLVFFRIP